MASSRDFYDKLAIIVAEHNLQDFDKIRGIKLELDCIDNIRHADSGKRIYRRMEFDIEIGEEE